MAHLFWLLPRGLGGARVVKIFDGKSQQRHVVCSVASMANPTDT
jgi:hypothetical protein